MLSRKFLLLAASAALALGACSTSGTTPAPTTKSSTPASAAAGSCVVGVSWNNFQQPRWAAHDEPGIQKTVEAGGGSYIRADANLSSEQQLTDITTMISKGAKVLRGARPWIAAPVQRKGVVDDGILALDLDAWL